MTTEELAAHLAATYPFPADVITAWLERHPGLLDVEIEFCLDKQVEAHSEPAGGALTVAEAWATHLRGPFRGTAEWFTQLVGHAVVGSPDPALRNCRISYSADALTVTLADGSAFRVTCIKEDDGTQ